MTDVTVTCEYCGLEHECVGPASPGRDPAPPVNGEHFARVWKHAVEWAERSGECRACGAEVCRNSPHESHCPFRLAPLPVRGVRDPSPPDLARQWKSRAVELMDNTNLSIVQTPENAALVAAAMSIGRAQAFFEAANELGVRGSGVVPSAPPDMVQVASIAGMPCPKCSSTIGGAHDVDCSFARPLILGVDQGGVTPAPDAIMPDEEICPHGNLVCVECLRLASLTAEQP